MVGFTDNCLSHLCINCISIVMNVLPLFVMQLYAICDCIGGLHSSLGITAFVWNIIYSIGAFIREKYIFNIRTITAFCLPILLLAMCICALPCIRHNIHNTTTTTCRINCINFKYIWMESYGYLYCALRFIIAIALFISGNRIHVSLSECNKR